MKRLLLFLLFKSSYLMANTNPQLTLYFIPSPLGIDWSTPSSLAWSALKNRLSFKSRFIGHVFVELECENEKYLTGMKGKHFDYFNQVIFNGKGLGVLYHSFEGTLEERDSVAQEIEELSQEGERMNFVRYKLNQSQCLRASIYLKEYREQNVGRYYGLVNRPRYAEGAGCSAFGASFLEVLGFVDQDIKDSWSQTVNIPHEFAGPPLRLETVNIINLIMNASRWANEKEPHHKLTFWSPDSMFLWVKNKLTKAHVEKQFSVLEIGKSKGIVFDKSHLPAPMGPIWLQHLEKGALK